MEGHTADFPPAGSDIDLIAASRQDATLTTVREWVQSGVVPAWSDCVGLSPELRCWRLQIGNLSVNTERRLWHRRAPPSGASQLVVTGRERQDVISRFHDSPNKPCIKHHLCCLCVEPKTPCLLHIHEFILCRTVLNLG